MIKKMATNAKMEFSYILNNQNGFDVLVNMNKFYKNRRNKASIIYRCVDRKFSANLTIKDEVHSN